MEGNPAKGLGKAQHSQSLTTPATSSQIKETQTTVSTTEQVITNQRHAVASRLLQSLLQHGALNPLRQLLQSTSSKQNTRLPTSIETLQQIFGKLIDDNVLQKPEALLKFLQELSSNAQTNTESSKVSKSYDHLFAKLLRDFQNYRTGTDDKLSYDNINKHGSGTTFPSLSELKQSLRPLVNLQLQYVTSKHRTIETLLQTITNSSQLDLLASSLQKTSNILDALALNKNIPGLEKLRSKLFLLHNEITSKQLEQGQTPAHSPKELTPILRENLSTIQSVLDKAQQGQEGATERLLALQSPIQRNLLNNLKSLQAQINNLLLQDSTEIVLKYLQQETSLLRQELLAALGVFNANITTQTTNDLLHTQGDQLIALLVKLKDTPEQKLSSGEQELLRMLSNLWQSEAASEVQDRAPQRTLERVIDHMRERIKMLQNNSATQESSNDQLQLTRMLENFVRGQETLQQLNTLFQATGEPTLLLFPMFTQGLLSQLEILHYPRGRISEEEADSNTPSDDKQYERLRLRVQLPHLGSVHVDLAHREKQDVLLNLYFDKQVFSSFIESKVNLLERALLRRGYKQVAISIKTQTPRTMQPTWLKEVLRPSGVVA